MEQLCRSALWRSLTAKREVIEAIAVIVVVLLACDSNESVNDTSGKPSAKSDDKPKVDLGPCADLKITSIDDAFNKDKVNKCAECCKKKAPKAMRAYYHFEGNAPPGRCRCVVSSPTPATSGKKGDCSHAKDMGACLSCCLPASKGAEFKKGEGCVCQ